ncbi:MAG: sigma-70 family RNA polymerase sigma factor, partial [Thermoanaerobaculia bacterium]|nr:sigma-70 family RNA polymerase sigma factor [Thermoanaerobaculia bacterium]
MENGVVGTLRRCAESESVDLWIEFERRFRPCLVAGITRALRLGGVTPDRERRRELLQEVYCRLLERDREALRRFRGSSDGEAFIYLKRVATSVALDRLRYESAAKRGAALAAHLADHVSESVPSRGPTPEQLFAQRESWRAFWRDCRRLLRTRHAARDLAVLQLAVFEGWTSREIATAMVPRLSVSAVDTILHRVRRRLAGHGVELPER